MKENKTAESYNLYQRNEPNMTDDGLLMLDLQTRYF